MNIDNFEDRTAELENTEAHLHRKIGDIDNYSSKLDDVLTMIANSLAVLIKEREIQLSNLSEHHGDFVGSFATLVARVDKLENTTSGMAVMKLQDSIDELQSDIESIERRLDDAEVTITI
jgi:peptidoglycan hydrolase CwlO-like protein